MELLNNYKILYEESSTGYATKNIPGDLTSSEVTLCIDGDASKVIHLTDYRLVYENVDEFIYGSTSGLPSENDDLIAGLDKNGEVVFGKIVTPPQPTTKYTVAVSDDSIEYRSVTGIGEYAAGKAVEVKFTISVHYDIEHIFADKNIADLVITSGTSETEGNWVKANFTMPEEDVTLTLSADPIIKINTTVPYMSLIGFNKTYAHGTNNIYLRIVGINDDYSYIAEGKDATDTDIGFNWQQKVYDMGEPVGYEMEVTEMPETDLTINFRIEE